MFFINTTSCAIGWGVYERAIQSQLTNVHQRDSSSVFCDHHCYIIADCSVERWEGSISYEFVHFVQDFFHASNLCYDILSRRALSSQISPFPLCVAMQCSLYCSFGCLNFQTSTFTGKFVYTIFRVWFSLWLVFDNRFLWVFEDLNPIPWL